MRKEVLLICLLALVVVASGCVENQDAEPKQDNFSVSEAKVLPKLPVLQVKNIPIVSNLDGNQTIAYEVFIQAFSPIEFDRIEIVDSESDAVLKTLSGDFLNARIRNVSRDENNFVAFLWLDLQKQQIPSSIYHRLFFKQDNMEESVSGAEIDISADELTIISSPLKGSNWLAASGPPDLTAHRGALIMLQGLDFFPERYAIDWVQFGSDGKLYENNGSANEDYHYYGSELIAVADGKIVDVKDGIPDNTPPEYPTNLPLVNYGGNYVVLEIDQNHYAFYAHLIPGTVRVKIGDEVKKGQVVGNLGNSGNSDAPHLHFHICDSQNFLFSEGLPYLINSYNLEGTSRNWEKEWENGKLTWNKFPVPQEKTNTMPVDGDIMGFSE